jgi:hypothetical protein
MAVLTTTHTVAFDDDGGGFSLEFVNNNGKSSKFAINGKPVIAPRDIEEEVVRALTVLDTAICKLAVNRIRFENVRPIPEQK